MHLSFARLGIDFVARLAGQLVNFFAADHIRRVSRLASVDHDMNSVLIIAFYACKHII